MLGSKRFDTSVLCSEVKYVYRRSVCSLWLALSFGCLFWVAGGGTAAATEMPLNFALRMAMATTIFPSRSILSVYPNSVRTRKWPRLRRDADQSGLTFDPVTHAAT